MSYENKINALKSINFFIGGLSEEGVNHYYEQMVRVGRIKEEIDAVVPKNKFQEIEIKCSNKREEILGSKALLGIIQRTVARFFDDSEEIIVLYDMAKYVISQMEWKKQDMYYNLLPTIYICCERLDQDFKALFVGKKISSWRDAYDAIYY